LTTGRRLRTYHNRCCYNWAVAFSPDGKALYWAGQDTVIHLWGPADGREKGQIKGHTGVIRALALSADGKVLASRSVDETIRVWDGTPGKERHRISTPRQRHDDTLALSPNAKILAWSETGGHVRVWRMAEEKEPWSLPTKQGGALAFSPSG